MTPNVLNSSIVAISGNTALQRLHIFVAGLGASFGDNPVSILNLGALEIIKILIGMNGLPVV